MKTPSLPPSPARALAQNVWFVVWLLLFRPTPRWALRGWRRFLLRLFGARIGVQTVVHPTCWINMPWNLTMGRLACLADHVVCACDAPVKLGDKATVSQNSMLCTTAYDTAADRLRPVAAPITIGEFAWVAANAYVGPGVQIGSHAVVGAGSVVTEDVEPWLVVGGNPVRRIARRRLEWPDKATGGQVHA